MQSEYSQAADELAAFKDYGNRPGLNAALERAATLLRRHNSGPATAGNDAAVAVIAFALQTSDPMAFLRYWSEGEFAVLRRNWPAAPEAVYLGADPLHPETPRR